MSSLRSGMPTPTLTENWDDDFDFDPAPSAPSTSSSFMTSSSQSRLPRTLQSSEQDGLSGLPGGNKIQPRVVESWDDDFEYEPSDFNGHLKAIAKQNARVERMAPPTLSPALNSMESATCLKTATLCEHPAFRHQRSNTSLSSHSTARSTRRDRKRSSEFPLQPSRSSLNLERPQLVTSDFTSSNETSGGKSLDASTARRDTGMTPRTMRKMSKDRLSSQGAKEGSFMGRVTSIKRRISGSLSTGPAKNVADGHTPPASKAMLPPPVPLSAFRSSSHVNTLPTLGTAVAGLPKVSFDESRKLQKKRQMTPGSHSRPSRSQQDVVLGLPLSGNSRGSIDTISPSQSVGKIASSDSGSAALRSMDSSTGISTESRAVSPTNIPGRYPSSNFSSPSPSLASLASHAGSYGFHLPSPAAGSAYNMFGGALADLEPQRQVSGSSATSREVYPTSGSVRSVSVYGVRSSQTEEKQKPSGSHALNATLGETRPAPSATEMATKDDPATTSRNLKSDSQADRGGVGLGPPDSDADRPAVAAKAEATVSIPRVADASHKREYKAGQTSSQLPEDSTLARFRFGAKPPSANTQPAAIPRAPDHVVNTEEASSVPIADRSTVGKARLTLRRIGSISRRHSRKISDGWRAVSGHSTSPAKTLASTESSVIVPIMVKQGALNPPRTPKLSIESPRPDASSSPQLETRPAASPSFETFGRGTSTPPRKTTWSATRPLSMVQPGTSPSGAIPVTLRSLSQNDSPSASKIGSTTAQTSDTVSGGLRPDMYPRRNSLGDLKIPSRVVSAQKGLKEEIGAMKQFAAGVQDLKALMAQHTILQAKQERLGVIDSSLESEYAKWWSLADLLIQLGETGSLDGNPSGGLSNMDNAAADIRRERRITLAADKVLPSSHLLRLADDNIGSLTSSIMSATPPLSGSMKLLQPTTPSPASARTGSMWRASTGQDDFSSSQLEQLRAILDIPRLPTERNEEKSIGLPPIQTSASGQLPSALPNDTFKVHLERNSVSLEPPIIATKTVISYRRPSKSTMSTIRDLWRGSGESQRSVATTIQRETSTRQRARPSLGSIFRRSSSRATVELDTGNVKGTSKITQDLPTPAPALAPPSTAASDDASQSSSISDWDTPPPEDGPSTTIRPRLLDQRQPDLAKTCHASAANEKTITRSDSRKLLAALGRGHVESRDGISASSSPMRPEFQIPAFSPTLRDSAQVGPWEETSLTLTPASLPALVNKLKDVTAHCREHLDAASISLKARAEE
ncbi:hypothetical protein NliqN6_1483 [Naganishia liquefaciens]|uniref:Uncharacterized protein n=1 Tax=Naganishia liquefaciens TaxID=104408 RepID=A0A8H3TPQ0_9TREE|nr:hypothetical protein NliqN6_1483 [Naganishia liquefaciens]